MASTKASKGPGKGRPDRGSVSGVQHVTESTSGLMGLAAISHPGLVLVFSGSAARFDPIALLGRMAYIGRGWMKTLELDDSALSRKHARVTLEGSDWLVEDLGSRNGTFVDGVRVTGPFRGDPDVLRVGSTLFLLWADIAPCGLFPLRIEHGAVMGPSTRAVFEEIERIARVSATLHVTGESGSGKELAARAFHERGPRPKGPFIAVNCATIPKELAERLLFGTRRGAYSGADSDAEGFVQAAQRGTLFLDEVGELDLGVQAKLLRVLESHEVIPLGATRPQAVDVRICSATLRSLRDLIASGRFREDLYFRLARPQVELPPLRSRLEEIPWLIQRVVAEVDARLKLRASLVEACLLRPWPGNVRELLTEIKSAAVNALAADSDSVDVSHLSPTAGGSLDGETAPQGLERKRRRLPSRDAIESSLRVHSGNVAATARALGMHRTQLRRWLEREAIDPVAFATGAKV